VTTTNTPLDTAPDSGRGSMFTGVMALVAILASVAGMVAILGTAANAAPQIGQLAPDFTAQSSNGDSVRLSQYRGKTVVLEWTNAECPYTRKHYTSGNMQGFQALAQQNGIVWLSIVSSAPGMQGYATGAEADALTTSRHAAPTAVLLDPNGTVGRLYNAKTTPHMFVIDGSGALRYMGGIDSVASAYVEDIAQAEPYLKEAMLAVAQGEKPPHSVTKPYGCAIKYSAASN
jgi:hypothetical protein